MLTIILSVAGGFLALWLTLIIVLKVNSKGTDKVSLKEILRLVPDVVRLLWRLTKDRSTPKRVRVCLIILIAYLASPLDLIPEIVPVIGIADDVIIVGLALRYVVKHSGTEALDKHWSGSESGLLALKTLAGVSA